MSTPAREAKLEDGRTSLGKYVKRMSSVFKRARSRPSPSRVATPPPAPSAAAPPPLREEVAAEPVAPAVVAPSPPTAATKQLDRSAMQQERARALFAKYGLTLEARDCIAPAAPCPPVQRVQKTIRMRVHRRCHRCGTLYGADKTCQQCEHKRCKKCPRYPTKKTAGDKDKDTVDKVKRRNVLTISTRSGTELAYQPPKQRIRRTCHKCDTLFSPSTATLCDSCKHVRCTSCPREPAKLAKWPAGYPGDVEPDTDPEVEKQLDKFRRTWRKPRTRVRWQCDNCYTLFLNHSPQCPGCGHERCDNCTRSPTKKAKKEDSFDPNVVAAVEAKLRALAVDDSQTSGAEAR